MNRPNDENKVGIFIARVITFFRVEKNCPIRIITDNRKVKSRYSYMLPSNFLPSISKKYDQTNINIAMVYRNRKLSVTERPKWTVFKRNLFIVYNFRTWEFMHLHIYLE